jgi:hypothetical protein
MATVNKDFKIKSGLIVEGTTGTINGYNILTESQDSVDFIIEVIGGETLITSVDSAQLQVVDGELSVKDNVFDASGAADAAETAANSYTDGEITTARTTAQGYATTAQNNAEDYADGLASNYDPAGSAATAQQNAEDYADQAELDAVSTANSYTDGRETAITTAYQTYADQAESDANNYTDTTIAGLNLGSTYDAYGAAAQALTDANAYTDEAVSDLVGSAPDLLNTLQELAAAIDNDPETINNLQDIAAGKQDALTAGSNIDITDDVISVTGLTTADVSEDSLLGGLYFTEERAAYANTGLWDTIGAALDAQNAALAYTDDAVTYAIGLEVTNRNTAITAAINQEFDDRNAAITTAIDALTTDVVEEGYNNQYFTDTRAQASAAGLLLGAATTNITITGDGNGGLVIEAENGVADSTTDDLAEGFENIYFTNQRVLDAVDNAVINPQAVEISMIARQVASTFEAATAGIQVAYTFDKGEYRSAEFLVKVAYGTHTEISKVLLTLDTSDNIAITEYGIVGTNGSASSISADVSDNNVRLLATTTNNNSTVTVMGTLLV